MKTSRSEAHFCGALVGALVAFALWGPIAIPLGAIVGLALDVVVTWIVRE